ncbi:MAG: SDR family oxidoreductase [Alphaproteobacteria bacterium]|nr:SDR family oxidoreductase [Alphaproteobacteria bacterium]
MEVRLDGRTALITGGSKGLGLAMATEFARSGADVAIVARREDVLKEAVAAIGKVAKTRIHAVAADVGTAEGATRTYEETMKALGKVDILVNNAGKSQTAKFEDITDAIWQDDLDLKVFAAIRLARLALPQMKQRRWGRIINVLNTGAKTPSAGSAPTTVSRAAGMALTKVLAGEGAPHNVLVNALLVGQIESDQIARRHKTQGGNTPYEEFVRAAGSKLPLGRMGTAQEFANIACLLASDAGGYISGTAINVDGGASPAV